MLRLFTERHHGTVATKREIESWQDLREAFKIFDRDGDGYISLAELKKVTTTLGEVCTNGEGGKPEIKILENLYTYTLPCTLRT